METARTHTIGNSCPSSKTRDYTTKLNVSYKMLNLMILLEIIHFIKII